jgi:hypothetical protein
MRAIMKPRQSLILPSDFPRQISDFIVTKSASFSDFGHGRSPDRFRGHALRLPSRQIEKVLEGNAAA